jgi:dTDP-4-dehydrorhamnose reductase
MGENLMKVVVIGANGQLGSDICKILSNKGYEVFGTIKNVIDVTNMSICKERLNEIKPAAVINTAAFHNVEQCERDPITSFTVNAIGARNLAILSNELDFKIIHFSTDYVFDGSKKMPYIEADMPLPLNVYGNTKLSGEMFIRTISKSYFIARVSGLFGISPCRAKSGLNFIQLMLKLSRERDEVRVVDSESLAPTYTVDVAMQIEKLLQTDNFGLYHMASSGACTWYEFAKAIFELTKSNIKLSVANPNEFPAKAPRPAYSVLENAALKTIGLETMPHWKDALQRYLAEIVH